MLYQVVFDSYCELFMLKRMNVARTGIIINSYKTVVGKLEERQLSESK